MTPTTVVPYTDPPIRILVFVDYWNLRLSFNDRHKGNFNLDWALFPVWLVQETARVAKVPNPSYRGMRVYASYDPSGKDAKFRNWMTGWMDKQPGVQVNLKPRKRKRPPKCPSCHVPVEDCPECGAAFNRTEEKGVDTAIATDMIRLAWEDSFDIAVLVSSDADFVPLAEFLDQKGKRVIQAGFPSVGGHELATKCWASFDIYAGKDKLERS